MTCTPQTLLVGHMQVEFAEGSPEPVKPVARVGCSPSAPIGGTTCWHACTDRNPWAWQVQSCVVLFLLSGCFVLLAGSLPCLARLSSFCTCLASVLSLAHALSGAKVCHEGPSASKLGPNLDGWHADLKAYPRQARAFIGPAHLYKRVVAI